MLIGGDRNKSRGRGGGGCELHLDGAGAGFHGEKSLRSERCFQGHLGERFLQQSARFSSLQASSEDARAAEEALGRLQGLGVAGQGRAGCAPASPGALCLTRVRGRLPGGQGRPSGCALRSPHRERHVDRAEASSWGIRVTAAAEQEGPRGGGERQR